MGRLKIWAPEEDGILMKVSSLAVSKKWKKASEELKKMGYKRSDIECRERYVNHLDPNVSKGTWSDTELQILYNKFAQHGNKWFLLQKHLPGRTQTKIKNYFYGNIRFLLKTIIKEVLHLKAGFVNDIKTDILLDIYQGKNKFDSLFLVQKTIKAMEFRVEKNKAEKLIREHRDVFELFVNKYFKEGISHLPQDSNHQDQNSYEQQETPCIQSQKLPEPETKKMTIVSTVAGYPTESQEEADYLRKMSQIHLGWHLHYKKAYEDIEKILSDKQEEKSVKQEP